MCPTQWQDQYNLQKKGMTLLDMHPLLTSLEAIEHICTQEKAKAESSKKASNKGKQGKKQPGTKSTARVPKKACTMKHRDLCMRYGGTLTMHNTKDCCKYDRDRKEKPSFHATKKGGKKPNPAMQNFVQLSKKLDKLRRLLIKQARSPRNSNTRIAIQESRNKLRRNH
jgi:hypothetical protein